MSRRPAPPTWAVSFSAAALTTAVTAQVVDRLGGESLRRSNFRERRVSLAGGPAAVAGLLAGALAGRATGVARATVVAVSAAAVAGGWDDLASRRPEERRTKGVRGHLAAVRTGRPSAGVVKVVVIGAGSLAAVATAGRRGVPELLMDAALVAGTANLVNLLDLRPGRAAKVVLLATAAAAPGSAGAYHGLAPVLVGATCAVLPGDLAERQMLGDTGANPLGAVLGLLLCGHPLRGRIALLTGIVALTGLSERISFSAVIEGSAPLRRLDRLGRRP